MASAFAWKLKSCSPIFYYLSGAFKVHFCSPFYKSATLIVYYNLSVGMIYLEAYFGSLGRYKYLILFA